MLRGHSQPGWKLPLANHEMNTAMKNTSCPLLSHRGPTRMSALLPIALPQPPALAPRRAPRPPRRWSADILVGLAAAGLLAAFLPDASAQTNPVLPQIQNLVAVQRPGTFFVDVSYNLVDPDSPGGIYILAEASADDGANYGISMRTLSGDVGLVTPGLGKKLVWNAWHDWGRNYTTNARVRLIADDFPSTIGSTNAGNFTTNVPPSTNFVWIPSGAFNMQGTYVYLTKGLWMGKYEVTQAEYQNVMSNNPSSFTGNLSRPVETVFWNDAVAYCQALTTRERAAGRIGTNWTYRLPTEAEWEYACRAGTTTTYCFGEDPYNNRLQFYAWYTVNAGSQTQVVGSRAPNRWGLYDMHGNVGEWCQDWYGDLPGGNVTDPQGPSSELQCDAANWCGHVMRGGSWYDGADACSSANRYHIGRCIYYPELATSRSGLRVVLAPVQ
jgi:formylglycine-generating enzyme required for sulfatase activity